MQLGVKASLIHTKDELRGKDSAYAVNLDSPPSFSSAPRLCAVVLVIILPGFIHSQLVPPLCSLKVKDLSFLRSSSSAFGDDKRHPSFCLFCYFFLLFHSIHLFFFPSSRLSVLVITMRSFLLNLSAPLLFSRKARVLSFLRPPRLLSGTISAIPLTSHCGRKARRVNLAGRVHGATEDQAGISNAQPWRGMFVLQDR